MNTKALRFKVSFYPALALLAAALVSVFLVVRFVDAEGDRDLRAWQIRLGIVADSRAEAVTSWIESQYATLTALAENASLQIYMTELSLASGDPTKTTAAAAQAGYLRNLLAVTAARGGVTGKALEHDVVDEIAVELAPVLLGKGIRFFGQFTSGPVQLDDPDLIKGERVTHLRFRVRHRNA